jgi:selenocysteine lyase/cysteine desulfurase
MQMEMIENNEATALEATVARLAAAAGLLEQAMERLNERQQNAEATIGRISATVESALEERLAAAEARIAELTAAAQKQVPSTVTNTRKTLPAGMATMLAKQGVTVDSVEAGALDTALTSLSLEQRIAVKAQLLRSGLLG